MLSIVPSIVVLGLVALVAVALARRHRSPAALRVERHAASVALLIATAVQSVHFCEEWATGFHIRFPALFGLPAMSMTFFVAFNLAWIAIWIVCIPRLRESSSFAFFAAWFLALAAVLNAIAHPLMAVAVNGYFPGLISSPLIGLAGLWLWLKLRKAVRPQDSVTS